jgi:hypothetical protein
VEYPEKEETLVKLTKTQKRKILEGMLARLSRRGGWMKRGFKESRQGPDGVPYFSFCLAGAANDAALEIGVETDKYGSDVVKALSLDALAAAKLGNARMEEYELPTFIYNDRSKTTKRDVLALVNEKLAELA